MDESEPLCQDLDKLESDFLPKDQIPRFQPQLVFLRWMGEVLGVFIIFSLIFIIMVRPGHYESRIRIPATPMPQFPQEIHIWMNDSSFASKEMFTDQIALNRVLENWRINLQPHGAEGGFVKVPDPENFQIGPPYASEKHGWEYVISVFHQLHCLSNILVSYSAARVEDTSFYHDDNHLAHCFDYIRQGLMCNSDSTLEGNHSTPETGDIIPWGSKHVCNNFDALRNWAEQNVL